MRSGGPRQRRDERIRLDRLEPQRELGDMRRCHAARSPVIVDRGM
jgi:hypothetical protein